MAFEPIGGYPPVTPKETGQIDTKSLESRGFASSNIVNISKIMDSKKKENLFLAFGTEDDDFEMNRVLYNTPHEYDSIDYEDLQ